MIFLTFGTGMGAGLILNGQLYSGTCGNAGEIGHIRMERFGPVGYGKAGSFEGFASGGGIAQMAKSAALEHLQRGESTAYCRSIAELDTVTAETVAIAAKNGDASALSIYRTCGEMLGRGLSVLIDLLNPQKIVIGSIYVRAAELLSESMSSVLRQECLESSLRAVRIVPAELGEQLGNYAALALAYEAAQQGAET
jgi:glucokinase